MPKYCVAYGCTEHQKTGSGIQFHRFPFSRPEILNKWVQAIRRKHWSPTAYSTICSKHFTYDSYQGRPGAPVKWLKEDAVPSVFNFSGHVQEKIYVRRPLVPKERTIFLVHFEPHMWEKVRVDGKRILKCNAIPTIFSPREPPKRRKPPITRKPCSSKKKKYAGTEENTPCSNLPDITDKQVHFDENQFESHRADGLRKLKPYAVPTIFNAHNPKKVRGRSRKLPANELHDRIKIEAVTSLSDNTEEVNKPEKMTISIEKSNVVTSETETILPKRKSARISIRGRRKWTNLYRQGRQTTTTQAEKTQTELMKTCPKEVRIVVERLGQPPKRISPEESSPKRKARARTIVKKSPRISEEASRKHVGIEDDVQRLMSFGEGSHQLDEDEVSGGDGKGNCAVCNKYTDNGTLLDSQTLTSKMHFYQKLTKLAAGENGLVVNEEGVLCLVCTRLLNYMDRIEVELSMLKTAILNCMRKKLVVEQKACSTDQDHHEQSGEGDKMDVVLRVSTEAKNGENVADDWQQTNDEQDPDEPEPVGDAHHSDSHHSSLEKADTSPEQIEITETKSEVPSKQYKCSVCSYTTTFKSLIIFHLRQHVKESYRCDFCNVTISRKSEKVLQMPTLSPLRSKGAVPVPCLPTGVTSTVSFDSAPVPTDCGAAVVSRTKEPADNNVEEMCTRVVPSNCIVTDAPGSSTISLSETKRELLVNTDTGDSGDSCIHMSSDSVTEFKASLSDTTSSNNLECVNDMPGVE